MFPPRPLVAPRKVACPLAPSIRRLTTSRRISSQPPRTTPHRSTNNNVLHSASSQTHITHFYLVLLPFISIASLAHPQIYLFLRFRPSAALAASAAAAAARPRLPLLQLHKPESITRIFSQAPGDVQATRPPSSRLALPPPSTTRPRRSLPLGPRQPPSRCPLPVVKPVR